MALRRQRSLGRPLSGRAQPPLCLHHRGLARPVRELARRGHEEARRRAERGARADRGAPAPRAHARAGQGRRQKALRALLEQLGAQGDDQGRLLQIMLGEDVRTLMQRAGIRTNASRYKNELEVFVDRPGASFAAWYEMFPRSQSGDPARHGTFDDVIRRLPYVRDMGFDVLYFPPIHPIGRINRKGRNNTLTPGPDDPGSPYAIGSAEGGHDAIHPELGTLRGFSPPGRGGARARPRDRARLRHPVLARPSLDQAASGMVRLAARRHASSTPRTRPRSTRTSSTSTSTAMPCPRSGTRCATSCCSGSSRASRSSASTIRTPSRCRSGNG